MARHRKKKCPNCGQETIVDDKWSSCQWCHWPLFVKHPPEIEQEKSVLWTSTWKGAVACIVALIIVYGLALLSDSGWELPVFQQLILEQWRILLLWTFIGSIIALIAFYAIIYLASRIRPVFLFGVLVTIGILLLLSSQKGNIFSQYISGWINARWDMSLFAASIAVFSFAGTFYAILINIERTKK